MSAVDRWGNAEGGEPVENRKDGQNRHPTSFFLQKFGANPTAATTWTSDSPAVVIEQQIVHNGRYYQQP